MARLPLTDDEQWLAKFHWLTVLAKAAATLLNVRIAHVSQRRNGQKFSGHNTHGITL